MSEETTQSEVRSGLFVCANAKNVSSVLFKNIDNVTYLAISDFLPNGRYLNHSRAYRDKLSLNNFSSLNLLSLLWINHIRVLLLFTSINQKLSKSR